MTTFLFASKALEGGWTTLSRKRGGGLDSVFQWEWGIIGALSEPSRGFLGVRSCPLGPKSFASVFFSRQLASKTSPERLVLSHAFSRYTGSISRFLRFLPVRRGAFETYFARDAVKNREIA